MPRNPAQDPRVRFADIYTEHYPSLERYAARRVPADDVGDVVATTFLIAWRRFDEVPAEPLPWLYATARRVIANDRRSKARWEALIARAAEQKAVADPDFAERVCDVVQVADALMLLSEADRELLLLTEWEQLSIGEAASVLGCSSSAARVRLHRARRRLTRHLSDKAVVSAAQTPAHPAGRLEPEPEVSKGAGRS